MTAPTVMIQGTMSSAGKSLLVTGLCRLFARRGLRVAPFKAQNMSNNAAVCAGGGEIGRAQYTQALACGIEPSVQMNPVLLKPEADARSQVIVNGQVWETVPAREYYERKSTLWQHVTTALDVLRQQYDLVILEGAGSPVELNLRRSDIVNMAIALYAESIVLLAGDIDRGGIFAQLLGTLMLLEPDERALVRGLLVNKFRGDPTLFEDGIHILEQRGGVPVLGVVPYIHDLAIPEEDAVAIEPQNRPRSTAGNNGDEHHDTPIDVAIMALPRIANFDDFDPLISETGVQVRYISAVDELGQPDAIIIPGTKSTLADLQWLHERGLAQRIRQLAAGGSALVGICGGYQMLGTRIQDPQQIESTQQTCVGLNLLPVETTFTGAKATYQIQAQVTTGRGWFAAVRDQKITGYEIHMGYTQGAEGWLHITQRGAQTVQIRDGALSADGRIWGCYLHGLFHNDVFRRAWLASLGWQPVLVEPSPLEAAFDHLADVLETHIDVPYLMQLIAL